MKKMLAVLLVLAMVTAAAAFAAAETGRLRRSWGSGLISGS